MNFTLIYLMGTNFRRNTGLLLAAIFIGFLIWSSVTFQNLFTKIVPFFENLAHRDETLSIFVFIGLGVLSTMLSSFSSVPLVPIAVIVWGNSLTAVLLFIGWILGDMIAYSIGYWAGHPILEKFAPTEKIDYWRKKIPPDAEFKLVFFFHNVDAFRNSELYPRHAPLQLYQVFPGYRAGRTHFCISDCLCGTGTGSKKYPSFHRRNRVAPRFFQLFFLSFQQISAGKKMRLFQHGFDSSHARAGSLFFCDSEFSQLAGSGRVRAAAYFGRKIVY